MLLRGNRIRICSSGTADVVIWIDMSVRGRGTDARLIVRSRLHIGAWPPFNVCRRRQSSRLLWAVRAYTYG